MMLQTVIDSAWIGLFLSCHAFGMLLGALPAITIGLALVAFAVRVVYNVLHG